MKEYVIISGKGGTGKTSLTAAFAELAESPVVCDADVDAADLHLLLQPQTERTHDFSGSNIAVINNQACTQCGRCRELCRFEAISKDFQINEILCEGCGVCVELCPEKCIDFPPQKSGEWYVSACRTGPMVHARLEISAENSGKLVTIIRQQARQLAEASGRGTLITDGPPGVGCPVIASLSGADRAIIITEPTVSGLHDAERVISLSKHFGIEAMVCVNRYDINLEISKRIEDYCLRNHIPLLPPIPFSREFVQAVISGKNIVEYAGASSLAKRIRRIWERIISHNDVHNVESTQLLNLKK